MEDGRVEVVLTGCSRSSRRCSPSMRAMDPEHVDVLIVGAGLSGIGAACHLRERCPGKSFAILEAREAIGGTWDLFRYPGIRSDSDMHTLGYSLPAVGGGEVDRRRRLDPALRRDDRPRRRHRPTTIRYRHRVVRADWSSADARWTVEAERTDTGETGPSSPAASLRLHRLLPLRRGLHARVPRPRALRRPGRPPAALARGPRLRGQARGRDRQRRHRGDAGPGAGGGGRARDDAAALADLRRLDPGRGPGSPTSLRRVLPARAAYAIVRWKNVALQTLLYQLSRRAAPAGAAADPQGGRRQRCRPATTSTSTSSPSYDPWDQRVCLVPDGDLFEALALGRAEIVTDRIETFTEGGISLESGRRARGRRRRHRDRPEPALPRRHRRSTSTAREVDLPDTMTYKGMMLSDVPNFAFTLGYTNASWTLKADLDLASTSAACSTTWTSTATPCCTRGPRPGASSAARWSTSRLGLRPPRPRRPSEAGREGAVEPDAELRPTTCAMLRYGPLDDGAMEFSGGYRRGAAARARRRLSRRRGQPDRASGRGAPSPRRARAAPTRRRAQA